MSRVQCLFLKHLLPREMVLTVYSLNTKDKEHIFFSSKIEVKSKTVYPQEKKKR